MCSRLERRLRQYRVYTNIYVEFDFERIYSGLVDEGKGRKALEGAERVLEAIRWYKKALGLWPALKRS
jgi:hypothetical protein